MAKHAVTGTGFESRAFVIKKWCKNGMKVTLKREVGNKHDSNAIAVYIEVRMLFGLLRDDHQIGYIKAKAAEKMAARLDKSEPYQAVVDAVYAQDWKDWPDVTLDIKFTRNN